MAGAAALEVLEFVPRNCPLGVVAAARLAAAPAGAAAAPALLFRPALPRGAPPALALAGGGRLEGLPALLRWAARSGPAAGWLEDANQGAAGAGAVEQWVQLAQHVVPGPAFEANLERVDAHLALRTFLVGHCLSLADLALWGQLAVQPMWEQKLRKKPTLAHVARWFAHCSALPALKATADLFTVRREKLALKPEKGGGGKKVAKGEGGSFDIGLQGAKKGKVVTRFPPEPSGYLHIGHAKAALLNQYFADVYEGKLLVRFDDTNPSKEKDEYVENIMGDIKTLGLRPAQITYTSDYFAQMLQQAERMIRAGVLYADSTPVDQMRDERLNRVENAYRAQPVEENLRVWQEMVAGSEEGQKATMRFRMDMKSPNGSLRDPVAYRCNVETPHHRTGTKYKLYPTYDFACPYVDALEGVTHALRTSEYKDREPQFYWILKFHQQVKPELPAVAIWDYARLNFVNTVMSKRKLQQLVDTGFVEGWDDPRFPTVQGLVRRGLTVDALREFILSQGASKNVTYQEWDKVWTYNKKLIDPVCPRYTAVEVADKVPVTLTNGPAAAEQVVMPQHPKNPAVGKKIQTRAKRIWIDQADAQVIKDGEEVTGMGWGNMVFKAREAGADGKVAAMTAELHLAGSVKSTKLKMTWLAEGQDLVPLTLRYYDHLITKKKVEDGDKLEDLLNQDSLKEVAAVGDANMRTLQKGTILQLERKGYFIVDRPLVKDGATMQLIYIPDGRVAK